MKLLLIALLSLMPFVGSAAIPTESVITKANLKLLILSNGYTLSGFNIALNTADVATDCFIVTIKYSQDGVIRQYRVAAPRVHETPWTFAFFGISAEQIIAITVEEQHTVSSTEF